MKLSPPLTTVTTFSKILAACLFVTLPVATLLIGFYLGKQTMPHGAQAPQNETVHIQPTPTPLFKQEPLSHYLPGWQLYDNPKLFGGISLAYPNDWVIKVVNGYIQIFPVVEKESITYAPATRKEDYMITIRKSVRDDPDVYHLMQDLLTDAPYDAFGLYKLNFWKVYDENQYDTFYMSYDRQIGTRTIPVIEADFYKENSELYEMKLGMYIRNEKSSFDKILSSIRFYDSPSRSASEAAKLNDIKLEIERREKEPLSESF